MMKTKTLIEATKGCRSIKMVQGENGDYNVIAKKDGLVLGHTYFEATDASSAIGFFVVHAIGFRVAEFK